MGKLKQVTTINKIWQEIYEETARALRIINISAVKFIKWISGATFSKGSHTRTKVIGLNEDAMVTLDDKVDETNNIAYDVAVNYTLSDSGKVIVDENNNNKASLKILSGGSQISPFDVSGNYTLSDVTKAEISGSAAQLLLNSEIPSSVIAYWKFNESTGTTISDETGSHDGTGINIENADWIAGKINNGLSLDGVNEYCNMGTDNAFNFERTDPFSVEFWIKSTESAPNAFLVSRSQIASPYRGWQCGMSGGLFQFSLKDDSDEFIKVRGNTVINDNVFHHCVLTYDGSSNVTGMKLYVDSVFETLTLTGVTTITGSTVLAGSEFVAVASANSLSGINFCQGVFDEMLIYDKELTQTEITARYNAGSGHEDFYSFADPSVTRDSGFVFTVAIDSFTETATKPTDTEIKYQVSSDNGTTYKWWNGSAWVARTGSQTDTWYYDNESNLASVVNTNMNSLAVSGTFKFLGFLHSEEGFITPTLEKIVVSELQSYSTTDDLYVDTKDTVQIVPSEILAWLTVTISSTTPANTDARVLFSNDGRSSWLTWNGSAWVAPTSATTRTDATNLIDAVTNFSSMPLGDDKLDVRLFLYTSDNSATPLVDNIQVINDLGVELTGEYESNVYDSTLFSLEWNIIEFDAEIPINTTLMIKVRSGNNSGNLGTYSSALTNGQETNISGRYIQWKAELTSTGLDTPKINSVGFHMVSSAETEVQP